MLGVLSGPPNMDCISAHGNCTVVMVTSGVLYTDRCVSPLIGYRGVWYRSKRVRCGGGEKMIPASSEERLRTAGDGGREGRPTVLICSNIWRSDRLFLEDGNQFWNEFSHRGAEARHRD